MPVNWREYRTSSYNRCRTGWTKSYRSNLKWTTTFALIAMAQMMADGGHAQEAYHQVHLDLVDGTNVTGISAPRKDVIPSTHNSPHMLPR